MYRKSTVRESVKHLLHQKQRDEPATRLKGRYLFRALVRLILVHIDWLKKERVIIEEDGTEIPIVQTRKHTERELSIQDRSILLIKPILRSKKDRAYILDLIKKLQAFKKYPNERESIAEVCFYRYFGPGRVIVRQNHPAEYLYYIINGNVALTKQEINNITGDIEEINAGSIGPGDIFGEVALLHSIPRTTTVITKSQVDFLCLHKSDFDRLLKVLLLENWDILQDALVTFNYFKLWDKTTIRECCILSKIKDYNNNEIILGDGKGMVNYVYFLLSGTCRLIEHMLITEEGSAGYIEYKLYNPEKNGFKSRRPSARPPIDQLKKDLSNVNISQVIPDIQDFTKEFLAKKGRNPVDIERISTVTATLQDVVNQWHEITDIATILMEQPSTLSQQRYSANVRTIFMQICEYHRGACFGLGEEMKNRRIVAITSARCLLIPRYWLLEHNHANIWERVKVFMNSKYPTRVKLFNEYVTNRKWMKYKKSLTDDIIKRRKNVSNNTTVHDVPYSIRINQIFD